MNDATSRLEANTVRLKERAGWFAAGDPLRRALAALSAGAFQLFAYICLQADRRTGRYEASHAQLPETLGKSRRAMGDYMRELVTKGVCSVRRGANQYARSCCSVCEDYWPYHRGQDVEGVRAGQADGYVRSIEQSFVSQGCTAGRFSSRGTHNWPASSSSAACRSKRSKTPCFWGEPGNTLPGSMAPRPSRSPVWLTSRPWSWKSRSGRFPRTTGDT